MVSSSPRRASVGRTHLSHAARAAGISGAACSPASASHAAARRKIGNGRKLAPGFEGFTLCTDTSGSLAPAGEALAPACSGGCCFLGCPSPPRPSACSFTVRPVSADSAPGTVSRGCGGEQSLREAQPRGNASWDSSVRLSGARSSALSVGRLLRQTSDHPIEAPAFGTLPLPRLYGRQTASCCESSSLDYFSVSAWPLKGKPHGAGTLSYSLLYLVPEY